MSRALIHRSVDPFLQWKDRALVSRTASVPCYRFSNSHAGARLHINCGEEGINATVSSILSAGRILELREMSFGVRGGCGSRARVDMLIL